MALCSKCGTKNDDANLYCIKCGSELQQPQYDQNDQSTPNSTVPAVSIPPTIAEFESPTDSKPIQTAQPRFLTHIEEQQAFATRGFASAVAAVSSRYQSEALAIRERYDQAIERVRQTLTRITQTESLTTTGWSDPVWETYTLPGTNTVPVGVRLGTAVFRTPFGDEWQAPALVPILNQGNLLFVASGAAKKTAILSLQSAMLRLVATFPPGKLQYVLIDPVGLGANVAGFMGLPEQVVGMKAWTEPPHIEQQLKDLSSHMENVIQKYLRNDYPTMEAYNAEAGEVAEPYRFLVVVNFPANFTDAAARRLISIAANGPRAGVYVLSTVDVDLPLPYGFNLPDLLRTGSVIDCTKVDQIVWRVPELDQLDLILDKPPSTGLFNRIVSLVGEAAKAGDKVEVPFERVFVPQELWWRGDSRAVLKAPIGRLGARDIQCIELGEGMKHYALVAGKPGSGKSTLLHVLITSLALAYPPEELELYLVDFKKGVEFKDYAEFALPHARVVGIESEREFGMSVLREVQAELNRRGDKFRQVNQQSLDAYRNNTGERLPRVFLIIDEFQRLFSEDDTLASQASNILAHIVQQGRAFGIHVLLASQTLADAYTVGRATYDKMSVRIALQCSDADSRLILGEDNGAARLLSRPGEAVYNADNGRIDGNNFFQVAWLPNDSRKNYLRTIQQLAAKAHYRPPRPQIVFEGNATSYILLNPEMRESLASESWPAPACSAKAYLGEAIEIKPHTSAIFRRQSRSNLLVVGQDERTAVALITSALVSLCSQHRPGTAQFFLVDLTRVDEPWASLCQAISRSFPHGIQFARMHRFQDVVEEVEAILRHRIESEMLGEHSVYFIPLGLHRARQLREKGEYGAPGPVAQKLAEICSEGPDFGVHVVTWCDTYANIGRILDRRAVADFDMRVALQMSEDDSNQLVESPKAARIGRHRALLYDVEEIGVLEKFRPYELLTLEEVQEIADRLHTKV